MSGASPRERLAPPSSRRSSNGGEPAKAHARPAGGSGNGAGAPSRKGTQRQRLIDAMIELSAQSGYQNVSIAQLYSRAGVSPVSFYEQFADKEACLVAAYRESARRTLGQIGEIPLDIDWSAAAELALGRLLKAVQSDPQAGCVLFVEALAGGPAIRQERRRLLRTFERRARELLARESADGGTLDLPVLAVTGALRHIVSRHLRTRAEDDLPSLLGDGLAWLRSYAIAEGTAPWSTSAGALLEPAPLPPAPLRAREARLPPGRHGLPAGIVARSQRTRLINGTAEAMLVKGYASTTIGDIVSAAGVAKPVFYEHFSDKEQAFLEAQRHAGQHILDRCAQAYFSARDWPERVWRMLETLIGLITANPAISHLRLVECYAAGPNAIRRAEDVTRSFTFFLEEGYGYRAQAHELPRLCSQASAGAIFEVVQQHVARRDLAGLAAHLPQLTYIAIAPFTGAERAIELVHEIRARHPGAEV